MMYGRRRMRRAFISLPTSARSRPAGEKSVKPDRTKDYTLTATGHGGSAEQRSVTVTVTEPPPPPPQAPSRAPPMRLA